jgi:hypothetical protein
MVLWSWKLLTSLQFPSWKMPPRVVVRSLYKNMEGQEKEGLGKVERGGEQWGEMAQCIHI